MSISDNNVWVLIPAAGVGSRMQSATPKQYLSVHGVTILEHTLSCFTSLSAVAGIVVLVSEKDDFWQSLQKKIHTLSDASRPIYFTYGSSDRASTVGNGLHFLLTELGLTRGQWVMVHDAARPCVRQSDLLALLDTCTENKSDGAILACPVKDTMKRTQQGDESLIASTEPREGLWHALTPQLFKLGELSDSLSLAVAANYPVTDEASAMEFSGKKVALVQGAADNIKLTSPSDLKLIEFLLSSKEALN